MSQSLWGGRVERRTGVKFEKLRVEFSLFDFLIAVMNKSISISQCKSSV